MEVIREPNHNDILNKIKKPQENSWGRYGDFIENLLPEPIGSPFHGFKKFFYLVLRMK